MHIGSATNADGSVESERFSINEQKWRDGMLRGSAAACSTSVVRRYTAWRWTLVVLAGM